MIKEKDWRIEEELSIKSDNIILSATRTIPKTGGLFPFVLFIHGSGSLDRNSNAKGFELNLFNSLASLLAWHGIASFRYDKRGCGKSSGNYLKSGHFDMVKDASNVLYYLQNQETMFNGKVFLIGHSEGALISAKVVKEKPLSGMVLICPFAVDFQELLNQQNQKLIAEFKADRPLLYKLSQMLKKLQLIRDTEPDTLIQKIKDSSEAIFSVGREKINAKWYRDLLNENIKDGFKDINVPSLIIGAEKDLQCNPSDVIKISSEIDNADVKVKIVKDLTHLIRKDPNKPAYRNYKKLLRQPIDRETSLLIVNWITEKAFNT